MTSASANLPEPRGGDGPVSFEYYLDEFAAGTAGAMSPFGPDVEFPLPVERLGYQHPGPENRPSLAGD
jgi:succinate dehydrogenase / fumarate reductase iron-sulfur subunit